MTAVETCCAHANNFNGVATSAGVSAFHKKETTGHQNLSSNNKTFSKHFHQIIITVREIDPAPVKKSKLSHSSLHTANI